jgi:aspartyl-tRNA(Asn)/glutamyl-tRNA(Gln) amidotransferase subunit B
MKETKAPAMLAKTSKYVATIGLEVHAELATLSKMFCSCVNNPDEERPNVNICPICMAHPGTLPVLNKEAIKYVLKIGHAVGGTIADFTEWDRKQYFYPDIPKGYQLSQYKYPLVSGGKLAGVDLTRIHLEEDTAQSTHDTHEKSLVNYNRAGVPLMELVTEPVIHDAETAVKFAKELQLLLRYIGAGEANMEKGEMRVEANISVASAADTEAKKFGTKTEVKNLNSFRAVERAIAYEIDRQTKLVEAAANGEGGGVVQETRGWDEGGQKTFSQRAKESAHDYRYFPDPDIPKLKISEVEEFSVEHLTKETPELPWTKRERLQKSFGLTDKEVAVFIDSPVVADYFEKVVAGSTGAASSTNSKIAKLAVNYILTDYLGLLKKEGKAVEAVATIEPGNFTKLMVMISEGKLSSRGAKDTLALMLTGANGTSGANPETIAEENGFIQKNDEGEIKKVVAEIVAANPTVVEDYKKGKVAALQFFVGQGMKATKGSANPELLKKIILDLLA